MQRLIKDWRSDMKGKLYTFLLILFLILFSGCGKKPMIKEYYVLEPDSLITGKDIQVTESLPYNIDIREFTIAKAFSQPRIAVRLKSHKINYYYYHLWATHPSSAITYMVFRLIDGCDLFKRTNLGFSVESDYLITGNIHKLEIIEEDDNLYAHLNISFKLIDNKKNQVEVRINRDRKALLEEKSINGFAAQISTFLQQLTSEFLVEVKNFLSSK